MCSCILLLDVKEETAVHIQNFGGNMWIASTSRTGKLVEIWNKRDDHCLTLICWSHQGKKSECSEGTNLSWQIMFHMLTKVVLMWPKQKWKNIFSVHYCWWEALVVCEAVRQCDDRCIVGSSSHGNSCDSPKLPEVWWSSIVYGSVWQSWCGQWRKHILFCLMHEKNWVIFCLAEQRSRCNKNIYFQNVLGYNKEQVTEEMSMYGPNKQVFELAQDDSEFVEVSVRGTVEMVKTKWNNWCIFW